MTPDPVVNKNAERFIPVAKPTIGDRELNAVADVVKSEWISQGPLVAEFEKRIAEAHGHTHGIAVNSGTAALTIALAACDLRPGDEVICSSLTMVAAANAIIVAGGTPVFVDCDSETGNPCPLAVGRAITAKTKAAISPNLYGQPSLAMASFPWEQLGITLIEDCAEAHFARYPTGQKVGSVGRMAAFSFYSNKIIATGEGGMVVCSDEKLAERLRGLRSHAFSPTVHFCHTELAFGCRMTDLQAAIGLAQLDQRSGFLSQREGIAQLYRGLLSSYEKASIPPMRSGGVWWVLPLLMRGTTKYAIDLVARIRDNLRSHLAERGIETRTYFHPLHLQKHLRKFDFYRGASPDHSPSNSEALAARGLYLPLYPSLTDDDVDYICRAIRSF